MNKYLYMCVSQDKYELPEAVADSVTELGRMVNVTPNLISSCISKVEHGVHKKSRFVKILIEKE